MIRYLRHKEIDPVKWDECIRSSVNRRIYAFKWYLDIVSPGWDGLVEEDYRAVFPLTHRRKAGIRYLCQPFFTQQLGLFSADLITREFLEGFLSEVEVRFRFSEIQLNSFNRPDPEKRELTWRKNHELELIREYDHLSGDYPQNTRRNLRKALDLGVTAGRRVDPDELITLFRSGRGDAEGKLKFIHYEQIRLIMKRALDARQCYILGAFGKEDRLDAGACFLKDSDRIYFLFAASSPQARENGAMFMLIDQVIREHAGQPFILDFEGGDDPNLARFYRGFGAKESRYPMVRIDRLPGLISMVKKSKQLLKTK